MQIQNNSLSLTGTIGQTSVVSQNQSAGERSGSAPIGGDSVELSSFAAGLMADPSRLEQLQAAYASGTYNRSASQIANSLINDAFSG